MSQAVVDVSSRTVTYQNSTFDIRPVAENSVTVSADGRIVGRAESTNGAVVVDGMGLTYDTLYAIAEAWFAATISKKTGAVVDVSTDAVTYRVSTFYLRLFPGKRV